MLVIQLVSTHKRHFLFCHLQTALLTLFYTAYFYCKQTFFNSFELLMRNKVLFLLILCIIAEFALMFKTNPLVLQASTVVPMVLSKVSKVCYKQCYSKSERQ